MNCKRVQELMPLYVGRDLEQMQAQSVATHVQSCLECTGLVDEYRQSRQLLHEFTPPQFSDAVYADIRQSVLREIGRNSSESTAPTLLQSLAAMFRPRMGWAFATALLLVVSVFAFYFIANRRNDSRTGQPPVAKQDGAVGTPISSPSNLNKGTAPRISAEDSVIAGTVNGTHESQRRKNVRLAIKSAPVLANTPEPGSITAEAFPDAGISAESLTVPSLELATTRRKTLRVEMQTKDPNIRIIWFAPQPGKHDSPNKSLKGT